MSGLLVVIPVVDGNNGFECRNTILAENSAAGFERDELLFIDNTRDEALRPWQRLAVHRDPDGHNLGVARSWNIGARRVLDEGRDYLVICSSVMRFGPTLHTTWVDQMRRFWGADVIECDGHSWHLIAIHRSVFERVGLFDPAFWPGYFEGIDFGYRMRQLDLERGWPRCWVNVLSAHVGLHSDLVKAPPLLEHYRAKWNGDKGSEQWTLPWGDKPLDYIVEEPIPVLAERYGYADGEWW